MQKRQHTRIDDLTTVGHELAEEHLAIAFGARRRPWYGTVLRTGTVHPDAEPDANV
jgi:hypothetical protein